MKKLISIILASAFISSSFAQSLPYYGNGDYDNNPNINNRCFNINTNLRRGDRDANTSNQVTSLQEALVQLDYLNQDPTGYFGNATFQAVRNFQAANALAATGYVGPLTRTAIQNRTCNNNTSNGIVNFNPTSLPSQIFNIQNGKNLRGIVFSVTDNNNVNNNIVPNANFYIVNSNLSNPYISKIDCNRSQDGAAYYSDSDPTTLIYCPDRKILVSFDTFNMTDNQTYYFTVRTSYNNTNVDKYYSFQFKRLNNNYNDAVCVPNTTYYNNSCVCPPGYNRTFGSYNSFSCVISNYDYNPICALDIQVDLARCTCPSGSIPVYYPTYWNDGTRPGRCERQYTWWY